MAIRNAKFGGTDITFGEAGIPSADWNDIFNLLATREEYTDASYGSGSTTNNTYTTIETTDVSGESSLYGYRIFYHITGESAAAGSGGDFQLLITFDDASTTTESLGSTNANTKSTFIGSLNYSKRIDQVEIQAKNSDSSTTIRITQTASNESAATPLASSYITIK